jgi:hypothetical protein
MGKAYIRSFAQTKPLTLQPQKYTRLITLVTKTDVQTSIAIGWIRAPHAYVKCNDFVTFFLLIVFFCIFFGIFSGNRVAAERSVAQTCMMAQTTRFDPRRCLFGVSLMYVCIEGSRIPKTPQNFGPYGNFKPQRKC